MAALDPQGGQKYWFRGLPFPGVAKAGSDPGSLQFWFRGLPSAGIYPLVVPSAGAADGSASVSGVGAAAFASAGHADGAASVAGVGTSKIAAAGHADGSASAAGVTDVLFPAAGRADGSASVAGVGAALAKAAGHADGSASVLGIAVQTFPVLAAIGWPVHRRPTFRTIVASHPAGGEARTALWVDPLWEFELTIDALDSSTANGAPQSPSFAGAGLQSLQKLMGFFLGCGGGLQPFLYVDPDFNAITSQVIGIGDATATSFVSVRDIGGFTEPVSTVTAISEVTLGGVVQTAGSDYSLVPPNTIKFASAPGSDVIVRASFTYAFLCRFIEDTMDFDEFMTNLWQLSSLKFRQVRQ